MHSINFDPAADEWMESVVARLAAVGYARAGRSEVVREALLDLQEKLADHSDADILRFFVDRAAKRLLESAQRPAASERYEGDLP